MKTKFLSAGLLASTMILAATSGTMAQNKPLKLGAILDMSGLYADITGPGSEAAAKMAAEDFGGEVLGRKVEIVVGDHLNKADLSANIARDMLDNQGVEAIIDVAASATALAAGEIAKARNKIIMYSGPGAIRLTNEACGPYTVHYAYDLLQAQSSGAKVVGLANAGGDTINAIKQAAEFGLTKSGGQKMSPLLAFISDIDSVGLETAQGLVLAEAFYWDLNDETRAFTKRFQERNKGRAPTSAQAGVYSSVGHYLKAVKAAGTVEPGAVMAKMRELPVNDMFAKNGKIREDGRMVHDMYLFEVKKPAESKGRWDYYKLLATVPGDQAFQPLSESRCPLVKK